MRSSERAGRGRALLLLALLAGAAEAQEDRSAQALSRAQALLRQVSAQKQELEAANARLTAEVDGLRRQIGRVEAGLEAAGRDLAFEKRRAERAGGELGASRERLERTEQQLREATAQLRATREELRASEEAGTGLRARLAEVEAALADSEHKNLQLYQANVELLERYRDKGVLTALLQREPTGLKRVELENVLQEYRFKLEDSLVDPNREPGRAAVPAAAGSQ